MTIPKWLPLTLAFLFVATRALGAAVKFKVGVNLSLRPEMARALPLIELAHGDAYLPRGAFITSGDDGDHMDGSKHYEGLAVDLRTRDLTQPEIGRLVAALRKRLNGSAAVDRPYNVVVESDHLHVEYDPQ
jgi:hypothetical protein